MKLLNHRQINLILSVFMGHFDLCSELTLTNGYTQTLKDTYTALCT